MIGTVLNVAGILIGGIFGLATARDLSSRLQLRLKYLLGVLVIFVAMTTTWKAMGGSFLHLVKQLTIMLVALLAGNAIGMALRLQTWFNLLGNYIKSAMDQDDGDSSNLSKGFLTCTILFCLSPMSILGAILDGLADGYRLLALKACMDGLATMAFSRVYGWGVMLSVIPVLAWQGCVWFGARSLEPFLTHRGLLDSVNGMGGMLALCLSMVVLDVVKVPLVNYLPSLAIAPLLARWWGW